METTFIFVRHGEPKYDEIKKNEAYGLAWDFGRLTDDGVKQAQQRALDERFKDADLIISSPYTRSLETAAIIAGKTGLPVRVETNLHEWAPDLTFNNTYSEERTQQIHQLTKEFFSGDGERPLDSPFNYESLSMVRQRVEDVLNRYTSYKKVIVVCHGIVMNSMTFFKDHVEYCGVRVIKR